MRAVEVWAQTPDSESEICSLTEKLSSWSPGLIDGNNFGNSSLHCISGKLILSSPEEQ